MFFLLYRAAASGSQVCKAGLRPQLPNHSHTHLYNSCLYSSYPSSYGRFILITHILTHTHFHISHPQFNEEQIYICYISHFLFCCVFPDPPLLLTAAFDLPNYSLVCFCSTEHRFKCFPKSCSFAHWETQLHLSWSIGSQFKLYSVVPSSEPSKMRRNMIHLHRMRFF